MIIRDKKGTERIAMAYDFQDVTITFTPSEWDELHEIFSFHKSKIKPKANQTQSNGQIKHKATGKSNAK